MRIFSWLGFLLKITRSQVIARRYFVVNGFDGALTMLGIITGFYVSGEKNTFVIVSACLGAAVALGVSGFSSAYISEAAERLKELKELENAMLSDLYNSAHGQASRFIPLVIALINGLAPLLFSLIIIAPLGFQSHLSAYAIDPLLASIGIAFCIIFFLGIFLGRIGGVFWLLAGLMTLFIGLLTCGIIFLLTSY